MTVPEVRSVCLGEPKAAQPITKKVKWTKHFLWDGGGGGGGGAGEIWGSIIWKLHDPLKLANFTQMTPPPPPPSKVTPGSFNCKTCEYL